MRGGFHLARERMKITYIPHSEEIEYSHHNSDSGNRDNSKCPWCIDVPKHWAKTPVEWCEERENEQQERSPFRNPILRLVTRTLEQVVPHALPAPDTEKNESEGENHPNDYVRNHG